jgi:hypothetical protein
VKVDAKDNGTIEVPKDRSLELFDELMGYPDVAKLWQSANRVMPHTLLLAVHLKRDRLELKFFSTIATLGTAADITLQELRIECMFPADAATEHNWQSRKWGFPL